MPPPRLGLRAMARIVAKELLPRRIRVNLISPGPTDTDIFKRDASAHDIAAMRDMLSAVVPMGRMGTAEEWPAPPCSWRAERPASSTASISMWMAGAWNWGEAGRSPLREL
jgi:NAD(P)-dependent dehydrogenase (short-subunit alcohol dehydrogenase family)